MTDESDSALAINGLIPHRACQNCVRVKVKCVPHDSSDNLVCQRCYRLKKSCKTSAPVARKRRRVASSKVAQLEDRLNQLSYLLTPTNSVPQSHAVSVVSGASPQDSVADHQIFHQRTTSPDSLQLNLGVFRSPDATQSDPTSGIPHRNVGEVPSVPTSSGQNMMQTYRDVSSGGDEQYARANTLSESHNKSAQPHCERPVLPVHEFSPIFLDPELEDKLFTRFKAEFGHFLPFVVIDAAVRTQTLKRQQPFLFWACLIPPASSQSLLQKRMIEEAIRGMTEHAFVKGTKCLDLLQGLLVLIAWHLHCSSFNNQFTNLLHLANALAIDLGLNRSAHGRNGVRMITDTAELIDVRRVEVGLKTSHERRALLGCYWLTSKASLCFTRVDPLRYSRHTDECCQYLKQAAEHPSDEYLVELVRLHHTTNKYIWDDFKSTSMPLEAHFAMFSAEITRFQLELPPLMRDQALFVNEIHSCKVCIYEQARYVSCDSSLERLGSLHLCLASVGDFFDSFNAIPVEDCPYLPFGAWLSAMHCITVHARLCFLVTEGWDLQYVRRKLSFEVTTQSIIDRLEAVHDYLNLKSPGQENWRFHFYATKMRKCKPWYEAKLKAEEQATAIANSGAALGDMSMDAFALNSFDEHFQEMFWGDVECDWAQG